MNQGDTIISFLLILIVYFLYQIAKQLTYLTGRRMKISFFNREIYNGMKKKYHREPKREPEDEPPTKLTN